MERKAWGDYSDSEEEEEGVPKQTHFKPYFNTKQSKDITPKQSNTIQKRKDTSFSRQPSPNKEATKIRMAPEKQIFLSGFPEETVEWDIEQLCNPFGQVTRVYIAKDWHTQLSRGYGFVTFDLQESVSKAIQSLNGSSFQNVKLKVTDVRNKE